MNKQIFFFICIMCLFATSCGNDKNEPEIYPIRFEQQDYAIRFGVSTNIGFIDGGGVYELTASRPEVLGTFRIDSENRRLIVTPVGLGESTLTITDVLANSSVTLKFTVEDFYLSFRIDEIEGKNNNPYLSVGGEIRFVRDADNTKQLKIFRLNHMTHKVDEVANGVFAIERSETNIFTLNMALHAGMIEELETFSYIMGGDGEYLGLFDRYFEYNWDKSIASRTVERWIRMILTDPFNDCKITCTLQPF